MDNHLPIQRPQTHPSSFLKILAGNNNLTGTFPEGLYQFFPFLQSFSVYNNCLRGTLPPELFETATNLYHARFLSNQFTGILPPTWWKPTAVIKVNVLDVGNNRLVGTIPTSVGNLVDLKSLILAENNLTGELPSNIGNMNSVSYVDVSQNNLTGNIPTTVGNWSMIAYLHMQSNALTGAIPSEVGQWHTSLSDLRLQDNRLTGSLPKELYTLTMLQHLDLSQNDLSGTISSSISNFGPNQLLYTLLLNFNKFHGTIPSAMGNLTQLVTLEVQGNDLTGTMPLSVCEIATLHAGNSYLIADCEKDQTTGMVEIECSCCTSCCTANGASCFLTQ